MGGAERVVFAFGTLGEARQAAALPQRADAVAASRQDLVRVALVADVPDQAVPRRIEDMMQRNRQLDHAKTGAEMSAGLGHRVDEVMAQLVSDLSQPVRFELAMAYRELSPASEAFVAATRVALL